ncbi:MAG: ISAs1 family transposase [Gammaproteobacteria bacterium]|nr:ISAs1 family transposase [Gammaproteobacteria bacterium]
MPNQAPLSSLSHCFASLNDPRIERHKHHQLIDILTIAICAIISGADNWVEIEEFGKAKIEWLRGFVKLPNGIPSHDTFGNVFARLCPKQFQECFLTWVRSVFEVTQGQLIAIDGKRLRRSHDRGRGKTAIHMVSAWACANRLVLGQVKTDEKSNEITAIPELLRVLELKDCIVTIDAMGCQTAIADQIIAQGGAYVLALKGNQSSLHDDVRAFFADPDLPQDPDITVHTHETTDGDHARVEIRRYRCTSDLAWLDEKGRWTGLRSICAVESERHIGDEISREVRHFIGAIPADPKLWAYAARGHWGIENTLHWTLDVAFREDDSRVRKGHADENLAVLRHIALNLITQERSNKRGTQTKRRRAGWDDAYRLKVLAG